LRPFYGNFEVSIDDKNRILIPSEIRKVIEPSEDGEAYFGVTGINRKLWLYPEKRYERYALTLQSELAPESDALEFDQLSFAMASRLEPDKQGRVLLPEKLIRKAGLGKEVTVVGMRDHVEVWNRADWDAQEEELDRRRAEIAMRAKQKQAQSAPERL